MQEHKYSIKEWAKDDRPREKLLSAGAENLSNSELLAILLRNGSREVSAVDLAKEIMKKGKNDLVELGRLSVAELCKIKGIGVTKAATIVAALELGKRRQTQPLVMKKKIGSSAELARYLQDQLGSLRHEAFAVLYLNNANKINHFEVISEGGITSTVADPRIILRRALEEDAVSIILCHNHPSGNLNPSQSDEQLTMKIKMAASFFDIRLLDHIIVSADGYFSFADEGRM